MNWADTLRASALAALAEHKGQLTPSFVQAPARWIPHEIWLKRSISARDRTNLQSPLDPAAPHRRGIFPDD